MTDRELLELAAKAAGLEYTKNPEGIIFTPAYEHPSGQAWKPLTDDGDALRLAVKLRLTITPPSIDSAVVHQHVLEGGRRLARVVSDGDHYAATRRAIVRAAAEIGRAMP